MQNNKKKSPNLKCVIVSCFHEDLGISRSHTVLNYLRKRGADVSVLYAKFSHSRRIEREILDSCSIAIPTISYNESISIRRFLSHFIFSFKAANALFKLKPDLVYINIPPNLTGTFSVIISKLLRATIILDIVDIWPEALLGTNYIKKNKVTFYILKLFGSLGRLSIKSADFCVLECDLYRNFVNLQKIPNATIHLMKPSGSRLAPPTDNISIAYLGGMSEIYDFTSLFEILNRLSKNRTVELHILGDGPIRNKILEQLHTLDILIHDHGSSFDENYKSAQLSGCWFGYNGYKDSDFIGLSYKSVDYLSMGIPILNSLRADTFKLINDYGGGINFEPQSIDVLIEKMRNLTVEQIITKKIEALKIFDKNFSEAHFNDSMDNLFKYLRVFNG